MSGHVPSAIAFVFLLNETLGMFSITDLLSRVVAAGLNIQAL